MQVPNPMFLREKKNPKPAMTATTHAGPATQTQQELRKRYDAFKKTMESRDITYEEILSMVPGTGFFSTIELLLNEMEMKRKKIGELEREILTHEHVLSQLLSEVEKQHPSHAEY